MAKRKKKPTSALTPKIKKVLAYAKKNHVSLVALKAALANLGSTAHPALPAPDRAKKTDQRRHPSAKTKKLRALMIAWVAKHKAKTGRKPSEKAKTEQRNKYKKQLGISVKKPTSKKPTGKKPTGKKKTTTGKKTTGKKKKTTTGKKKTTTGKKTSGKKTSGKKRKLPPGFKPGSAAFMAKLRKLRVAYAAFKDKHGRKPGATDKASIRKRLGV